MECKLKRLDTGHVGWIVYKSQAAAKRQAEEYKRQGFACAFEVVDVSGLPIAKVKKTEPRSFVVKWGKFRKQLGGLGWVEIGEYATRKEARDHIANLNPHGLDRHNYKIEARY